MNRIELIDFIIVLNYVQIVRWSFTKGAFLIGPCEMPSANGRFCECFASFALRLFEFFTILLSVVFLTNQTLLMGYHIITVVIEVKWLFCEFFMFLLHFFTISLAVV